LIADMITFENANNTNVASPIAIPLIAELVTPSVGHNPSNNTNTGFPLINGSVNNF